MYWVGSRRGVLKSENGGLTWDSANSGLPGLWASGVAMDPSDPDQFEEATDIYQ
jgi:hypothetical protein